MLGLPGSFAVLLVKKLLISLLNVVRSKGSAEYWGVKTKESSF